MRRKAFEVKSRFINPITSDDVLDIFDIERLIRVNSIVQNKDGSICIIENFDITKCPDEMPVTFKRLCNGQEFNGVLTDITGFLMPVEM